MSRPSFGKAPDISGVVPGEAASLGVLVVGLCLLSVSLFAPFSARSLSAQDDMETIGGAACLECHGEIQSSRIGSNHGQVDCESCHGPLASHARDPERRKPPVVADDICLMCHEAGMGMPASFPTVAPKEHNPGSTCTKCHPSHFPEEGKKKGR